MNVRLLPAAQSELDEAIRWYAQQAQGLGDSF
jgi:toxin ParE2